MISISHVEHEIISPEVKAVTEAMLADRDRMALVPDRSGTVSPEMVASATRSLAQTLTSNREPVILPDMTNPRNIAMAQHLMRHTAPVIFGHGLALIEPSPLPDLRLFVSDTYDAYSAPLWKSKSPSKSTYSRKRRKSTMRRNRK